ncbi:MAG TPA: 3'-5' exonuclease, partial [Saprospiraceae bacterium]|nr:3'-5' exonuclease [Saprospiraceae bacterium]
FDLSPRTANSLKQFKMQIEEVRHFAAKSDAYQTAVYAYKLSGMSAELKQDLTNEGIQRQENVMALLDGIKNFTEEDEFQEAGPQDKSLSSYLQFISLITELDQADDQADYVTLMSVHSAKGLEFNAVIVGGLEENLFPSFMASKDPEQIDEERRLFYVAITRAKQHLALSYANTRYVFGNLRMSEPSRFIDEIDPARMELEKSQRNQVFDLPEDGPAIRQKWVAAKPRFSPAAITDFKPSPSDNIQSGMMVLHQKFGRGKVITIEGSRDNRVATILFNEIDNPQRKIILKFAKLQILP